MRNIIKDQVLKKHIMSGQAEKKTPYLYPLKNVILIQNSKSGFIY